MNDLSECCLESMWIRENSEGEYFVCSVCLPPCCPVDEKEEMEA